MTGNNATNKAKKMATQIQLQIPVTFEFTRAREVSWAAGTGWIWGWDGYDFAATVRIESTGEERQLRYKRGDLPRELRDKCDKTQGGHFDNHMVIIRPVSVRPRTTAELRMRDESVQKICSGFRPDLLVCDPAFSHTKADPWTMRDEFLRAEPGTKSILHFLNRWGAWDNKGYLRVGEFEEFQQLVRKSLLFTSEQWFKDSHDDPFHTLERQAEYPHFAIRTYDCREAILATITVDKLRGTKFMTCARPDCLNPPFEITRPDRTYCCQYCAHLESIRRQARKKKSRRKK